MRQDIPSEDMDRSLQALSAVLATYKPDLVILDTLAALFALASEIDNNAITMLMRRLGRVARDAGCAVLLLHHTPKLNRAAAAEQRGEATLVRGVGHYQFGARGSHHYQSACRRGRGCAYRVLIRQCATA